LIAKETGYNEDTVFSCLKSLEFMGYISRVQMSDKETGRFGSNVYQLFPKSHRLKGHRNKPPRVSPGTVPPGTKKNQR
jgi:DNA-binding IclR family transcriptional regulator